MTNRLRKSLGRLKVLEIADNFIPVGEHPMIIRHTLWNRDRAIQSSGPMNATHYKAGKPRYFFREKERVADTPVTYYRKRKAKEKIGSHANAFEHL